MAYDFVEGKSRVEDILDNSPDVEELGAESRIPKDNEFTFDNAYRGWSTGIFVDLRDSSSLFSKNEKIIVSKIIRSFTSELVEIFRKDDKLRSIGIRGDCVFSVFATPKVKDEYDVFMLAACANTYMKMLNILLQRRNFPAISAGIGMATAIELVVKAGRDGVGINDKVWIGDAVTKASNFSSFGNKNNRPPIVLSQSSWEYVEKYRKSQEWKPHDWHKESTNFGLSYSIDVINPEFNSWIVSGMP